MKNRTPSSVNCDKPSGKPVEGTVRIRASATATASADVRVRLRGYYLLLAVRAVLVLGRHRLVCAAVDLVKVKTMWAPVNCWYINWYLLRATIFNASPS